MSAMTNTRGEALRAGVLEWLASRPSLSFDLAMIHSRINRSGLLDFTAERPEVEAAVQFLEDAKFVKHSVHELGSTRFYQVTAAGVLAFERGPIPT